MANTFLKIPQVSGGTGGLTIGNVVTPQSPFGDPGQILYVNSSGQFWGDPGATRDSTTLDTIINKSVPGLFDNQLLLGDPGIGGDVAVLNRTDLTTSASSFVGALDGAIVGSPFSVAAIMDVSDGNNLAGQIIIEPNQARFVVDDGGSSERCQLSFVLGQAVYLNYRDPTGASDFAFILNSTGIGWNSTPGFPLYLPVTMPTAGQVLGSTAGLPTGGQLEWITGSGGMTQGGAIAGGVAHEVHYTNSLIQLDSDAAFTRNMTTNVTSLSNAAGGITVGTSWDPTIGTLTSWADAGGSSFTNVDQRGLQIRAYDNAPTLENFVIKQASGLKLLEQKNGGYFFINNSTVQQSIPVFTGTGLNDLSQVPLSGFDALAQSTTYTITIDGNGAPDTFTWSDGVTTVNNVAITLLPNILSHNVEIQFAATTGHTIGDSWTYTVDYVVGRTFAANPNITDVIVQMGDLDALFNGTYFEVDDGLQRIYAETNSQQQLLHASAANDNVFLGYLAGNMTFGGTNTAIGDHALFANTGSANVAVGASTLVQSGFPPYSATTGNRNTAIGTVAGLNNNGTDNIYIGYEPRMIGGGPFNTSVAIGRSSYINASNQFAFGSGLVLYESNDFVFGGQERNGTGTNTITLRSSDGEVASNALGTSMHIKAGNGGGTDRPGGAASIYGGIGTGTGLGGDISFYTSPASGISGSTLNTAMRFGRIESTSTVTFGDVDNNINGWAFGSNTPVRKFLAGDIGSTNNGMLIYADDIAQIAGIGDLAGIASETAFKIDDSANEIQAVTNAGALANLLYVKGDATPANVKTAIGFGAGSAETTGVRNTYAGGSAGAVINDGDDNSFFGWGAGAGTPATGIDRNTGFGVQALFSLVTNQTDNTAIGYLAQAIGVSTVGSIAIGSQAFANNTKQCVIGSTQHPIEDYYFGGGIIDANSFNYQVNYHLSSSGSGTDGGSSQIGIMTGDTTGDKSGVMVFYVAKGGASGTTPNLAASNEMLRLNPDEVIDYNGIVHLGITALAYGVTHTLAGEDYHMVFSDQGGAAASTINIGATTTGKEIIVSDGGHNASTYPITLDAGVGNLIYRAGFSPAQTTVLNVDSGSIALHSIGTAAGGTADWMVI